MVADFEEVGDYEIPDNTYNPEVLILHEIELAELREHLAELDDEDRQFLLDCFDSQIGFVTKRSIGKLNSSYGLSGIYSCKKYLEQGFTFANRNLGFQFSFLLSKIREKQKYLP